MRIENHDEDHETTWIFDKSELSALVKCASRDEGRVNLTTIALDADRGAAVSTDGHRLARCFASEKPAAKGIAVISREDADILAKRARRGDEIAIRPNCETAAVTLAGAHGTIVSSEIKLQKVAFPPHDQVVPKYPHEKPAGMVALNGASLAFAADLAKAIGTKVGQVRLHVGDELGPIMIKCERVEDGSRWEYVLMPMRI